jgi:hypothetical protein
MLYDTIYLDMDGVICDFYLECIRAHLRAGKSIPWLEHHGTPLQLPHLQLLEKWPPGLSLQKVVVGDQEDWHAKFWEPLLHEPSTWMWMSMYPYTAKLIKMLYRYCEEVVLCSHASSESPQEYAGKKQWCNNHGLYHLELLVVKRKERLAYKPRSLLIDDFTNNVDKFHRVGEPVGSHGLLFPRPWNKLHALWRNPVDYVHDYLSTMVANETQSSRCPQVSSEVHTEKT